MHVLWRGNAAQRIRLATGLVLFAFAATHFVNHALGLVGLDAMIAFDRWRTAVTRSLPGTVILATALVVHVGSALVKLARRRTFRLPAWEWAQLALGLAIPVLLLPHIVNTRVANLAFGIATTYPYELRRIWTDTIVEQTALLLVVWVHACIGMHYWLRLVPSYQRSAPLLLSAATLLPFAAILGVVTQGRAMAAWTADPVAFAALKDATHWPDATTVATIAGWRMDARLTFVAVAAIALLFGVARTAAARRAMRIPVQYVPAPLVRAAEGPTLLEVSRMYGIPHMSVCGGRGRCSTCRVMVVGAESGLSAANDAERATLRAVGAAPNVRLACQARLVAAATVMPLIRAGGAGGAADLAHFVDADADSVERELAVLFVDIRGFTSMTEKKLPYDVVYLLNSFLSAVGRAVAAHGGWINDRAGDGVLAVFGDAAGLAATCRAALAACADIDRAIGDLNARLARESTEPLRIAMGLHCGPHVHGRIGIGASRTMSVVGPAVNVASRLEGVAKEAGVELAVSAEVVRLAGIDVTDLPTRSMPIRGAVLPLDVVLVARAADLVQRLAA